MILSKDDPRLKKGKRNRFKIGQSVVSKPRLVDWHATHLSWCAGAPVRDDSAYDVGQKEIRVEDLNFVYLWTWAKLSGKMPTGKVKHYGASDDTKDKNGNRLDRKNVFVEFKVRTSFGNVKYECYVNEPDLTLLR